MTPWRSKSSYAITKKYGRVHVHSCMCQCVLEGRISTVAVASLSNVILRRKPIIFKSSLITETIDELMRQSGGLSKCQVWNAPEFVFLRCCVLVFLLVFLAHFAPFWWQPFILQFRPITVSWTPGFRRGETTCGRDRVWWQVSTSPPGSLNLLLQNRAMNRLKGRHNYDAPKKIQSFLKPWKWQVDTCLLLAMSISLERLQSNQW